LLLKSKISYSFYIDGSIVWMNLKAEPWYQNDASSEVNTVWDKSMELNYWLIAIPFSKTLFSSMIASYKSIWFLLKQPKFSEHCTVGSSTWTKDV
jgi:hypothetical protein